MVRMRLGAAGLLAAGSLAACGAATSSTTSPTAVATASPTPAATAAPRTLPTGTAAPTSLDPCQLVTSQEASQLAGTTIGTGREQTDSNNAKRCFYDYQTTNVFTVEVVQAPDVATAQAAKAQALASIQRASKPGLTVTTLTNVADGAVLAQGSASAGGATLSVSSIGVLKGTVFFAFSDAVFGHPAPSNAAMLGEAQIVLGRLP